VGRVPEGLPIVGGDYIALWVARVLTVDLLPLLPADAVVHRARREKAEPQRVTW
jgi:hypothetical protein